MKGIAWCNRDEPARIPVADGATEPSYATPEPLVATERPFPDKFHTEAICAKPEPLRAPCAGGNGQPGDQPPNHALENAYKAVLGSHGIEYPVSGRDGQDLGWLMELIRERIGSPLPGEDYSYLTEFAGSGVAVCEHRPLEKAALAHAIPEAVREIISWKANAASETV